ncbi:hypothetical protein LIER_38917 [Lithospermum erythrorhizon]|uniref:Uncharacterized protein n=1 Tax=Lithospermum erythrorhizon TaxID=34254 RepID=A0AAV3Q6L2_LITER
MDGLQSGANIEVKRRNVRDIEEAITVAKDLMELKKEFPSKEKGGGDTSLQKIVEKRDNSPTGALTSSWRGRTIERDKKGQDTFSDGHKKNESRNDDPWRLEQREPKCYFCDGAHWTKECPQKKVLKSLACQLEKADGETYEEKINSLIASRRPKNGGLVYVEAKVNGGTIRTLIDTGATHNFISPEEARRLRISYTKETDWIKAVNSAAQPILGVACGIPIHLGEWTGTIDVIIGSMDDCHMVLGVEFFHQVSSVTFEKDNTMHLHEGATTYKVPLRRDQTSIRRISMLEIKSY